MGEVSTYCNLQPTNEIEFWLLKCQMDLLHTLDWISILDGRFFFNFQKTFLIRASWMEKSSKKISRPLLQLGSLEYYVVQKESIKNNNYFKIHFRFILLICVSLLCFGYLWRFWFKFEEGRKINCIRKKFWQHVICCEFFFFFYKISSLKIQFSIFI